MKLLNALIITVSLIFFTHCTNENIVGEQESHEGDAFESSTVETSSVIEEESSEGEQGSTPADNTPVSSDEESPDESSTSEDSSSTSTPEGKSSSESSSEKESSSEEEGSSLPLYEFDRIEVESGDVISGDPDMAGIGATGTFMRLFKDGDVIKFSDVDFAEGTSNIVINLTQNFPDAKLEFRLDSEDGDILVTADVKMTGSWSNFESQVTPIPVTSGVHDLYMFARHGSAAGDIDWISFSNEQFSNAPTSLEVSDVGNNTATLTWSDESNNERGFLVYSSTREKPSTAKDTLGPGETSITLSGLQPGSEFTFWVESYNNIGSSDAITSTATTTGDKPNDLRILSLNILFSADNQWAWSNRGPNVLFMMDEVEADIIGLQENSDWNPAGGASHPDLPSNLIMNERPQYAVISGGGDVTNTILYKKDRFDLLESGKTILADNAPWRHVGWALFYDKQEDKHFYFWNTHWDHADADGDGWNGHGVKMMQAVTGVAHAQEYPHIATGDFNSGEWSNGQVHIRNYNDEHPGLYFVDTWQVLNGMSYAGAGSYGSPAGGRIDYVFGSNGDWNVHDAYVYYTGEVISDHLPVFASISYK